MCLVNHSAPLSGLSRRHCCCKEAHSLLQDSPPLFLPVYSPTLPPFSTRPPCKILLLESTYLRDANLLRYTMAGLALVAGLLNTNIRPVAAKHFVGHKVNL